MIPADELDFLLPLDSVATMLELGNKANAGGAYKATFTKLGIRHTSVDWNGRDGAFALDLREPLNLGVFDMVTNIGTTEHVDPQEGVWRNVCAAAGKFFVSVIPVPGEWRGHGFYYPPRYWYEMFADANGFAIERLEVRGAEGRRLHYVRMVRRDMAGPFRFLPIQREPVATGRKAR